MTRRGLLTLAFKHFPAHTFPPSTMAEVKKQERDFTPEVEALVPEATALAKVLFLHLSILVSP